MKKHLLILALCTCLAATETRADIRLAEYGQSDYISNRVDGLSVKLDGVTKVYSDDWGNIAPVALVDVTVNPAGGPGEAPASSVQKYELLQGATLNASSADFLKPIKAEVTDIVNATYRLAVPCFGKSPTTISLKLGKSETCAYYAPPVTLALTNGQHAALSLNTAQVSGAGTVTELVRIQPYNSTAAGAGESFLARRVTSSGGTTLHLGYYDYTNAYHSAAGVRVTKYEVPTNATSIADCTPTHLWGSSADEDIFGLLSVLGDETMVDVDYVGDAAVITNVFVRFTPVYVKTTFESIPFPKLDADGNVASTNLTPCVCRWFCDTQADPDYHLHSAFVRYVRDADADTYAETNCPYAYIARYPISNASLMCAGVSKTVATSRSDLSNEIAGTREQFLTNSRAANNATIRVREHGGDTVLATCAALSDARAMSMIDLQGVSLVEDLAYLLFGVDSQSALRGVSQETAFAKDQQRNGRTDRIANLGVKLGGFDTTSSQYNFNFLDIEGGTWSAPGCMLANLTSFMERTTTTDAAGTVTTTTRNRYSVANDRLDYNPASGEFDALQAAGYRLVSFLVGGNNRIGMDDTAVMRDAKLYSTDKTQRNVNYGGCDSHWQGSAPAAIGAYSASATYAVGAYATYNGLLYQCSAAVTSAEDFDSGKWTLQANAAILTRNAFMVARGYYRTNGSGLGAASLAASGALGYSNGSGGRSRLSLQLSPGER